MLRTPSHDTSSVRIPTNVATADPVFLRQLSQWQCATQRGSIGVSNLMLPHRHRPVAEVWDMVLTRSSNLTVGRSAAGDTLQPEWMRQGLRILPGCSCGCAAGQGPTALGQRTSRRTMRFPASRAGRTLWTRRRRISRALFEGRRDPRRLARSCSAHRGRPLPRSRPPSSRDRAPEAHSRELSELPRAIPRWHRGTTRESPSRGS
jgi:hypothetical protein